MIKVHVPATTANLGAGYDLIGAALNWQNHFDFVDAETWSVSVSGPFAQVANFSLGADNLVFQAFCSLAELCGRTLPPQALALEIQLPPARGLGSSSTAIIAGLLAANQRLGRPLDQAALLSQAIALEGHPDNVAPALLGGCILNLPLAQGYRQSPIEVPKNLDWIVVYPDFELSTHQARSVVPKTLEQADCIRNMGYLSAFLLGLERGDPELIAYGLNDTLHQPYRMALVPGMDEVCQAARAAGALGCVLSGAGPTLLALSLAEPVAIGDAMVSAWKAQGIQAVAKVLTLAPEGATCQGD